MQLLFAEYIVRHDAALRLCSPHAPACSPARGLCTQEKKDERLQRLQLQGHRVQGTQPLHDFLRIRLRVTHRNTRSIRLSYTDHAPKPFRHQDQEPVDILTAVAMLIPAVPSLLLRGSIRRMQWHFLRTSRVNAGMWDRDSHNN